MRTRTKVWLFIATSFVLIGCTVFVGVMTMLKWDFAKLSTVKYETNNYEVTENFNNISIITETADVVFMPSESQSTSVVCYEQKTMKHSVAVRNGELAIGIADARKWYEYIGINFGIPKITVFIPRGEYGALFVKSDTGNIKIPKDFKFQSMDISENTGDVTSCASALGNIRINTSTGNICVENVSANTLDLSASTGRVTVSDVTCEGDVKINVSTGKTNLTDVECKNVLSNGDTGGISLKNVIVAEKLSVERDTGNVKFIDCDAAEIYAKTNTGNVTGTLLSDKRFLTETDTGNVDVPMMSNGGLCEIVTDTGDIRIHIRKQSEEL